VAVAVFNVGRDDEMVRIGADTPLLVGLRKGSHGEGLYALPGGWLEKGEGMLHGVLRELKEETGLVGSEDVCRSMMLPVPPCSNVFSAVDGRSLVKPGNEEFTVAEAESEISVHSVTVFAGCSWHGGKEPEVIEPDKCAGWAWKSTRELLEGDTPIFPALQHLLQWIKSYGIDLAA
jgi:8-oxo-dGTP pyrophosphatase MutT (NUDIX family)